MIISTIKNNLLRIAKAAAFVVICLGLWEILATAIGNSYFMPHVAETFSALGMLIVTRSFLKLIFISLLRVAAGLASGIVFGVILATVCHVLPITNSFISPLISIMKATPIATIILILWFTLSDASLAIFVVFLMITPIVWQNVYDGYKSISTEMREVCDVFQFGFVKRLKLLVFPTVVRYLIPAVITSIGLAWKAEIAAEIMTYSNIGRNIQDFKSLHYDTASVFAWALVIIVLSLILENVTKYFLRRIKV
ncbi:MAG: ABC transporter permease subunit [Clostridia bacterium]|nr:ABC transporter permease subunit [Clostridia bacterium]